MRRFQEILKIALEGSRPRLGDVGKFIDDFVYFDAAKSILERKWKMFVIATGFPIKGIPETDGPPGAIYLHDTLRKIGINSLIAGCQKTIEVCSRVRPDISYVATPKSTKEKIAIENRITHELITIEVCGMCADGTYRNMHGDDITKDCAKFEFFFGESSLLSIGDGGNEFGMKSLKGNPLAENRIPISKAKHALPASISNFGAYSLSRCIEIIEKIDPEIDPDAHVEMIRNLVFHGLVDGFSGLQIDFVDGKNLSATRNFILNLRRI